MDNSINLRPHHGLCINFFEGKGYSNEFTVHMANVIKNLSDDTIVTIAGSEDIICGKCPNMQDGKCTTQDKVMRYDDKVLKFLNLKRGDTISYGTFDKLIKDKIIKAGKMSEVCGDCGWAYICYSLSDIT